MSSKSKPLDPTFFVDRSLGRRFVAEALRAAGVRVEVHDDHFRIDERDDVWLPQVGAKGWYVITKDKGIKHHKLELASVVRHKVGMFVLSAGEMKGEQMAEVIRKALPKMLKHIQKHKPPFIERITSNSRLETVTW